MASPDQDRKSSIITHMNTNHSRQLSHFLRHYSSLPPSSTLPSSACSLTDIHPKHGLTIRAPSGKSYNVPYDPPHELPSTFDGLRDRVVGMDRIARAALGISDVSITEYAPPGGLLDCIPGLGVLLYFALAAVSLMRPGSATGDLLDAVGIRWFVEVLVVPIAAVHVAEALAFDRLRMYRHGVERWSSLWWKWEMDILVQGVFGWRKFDAIVKEKSKKGESKSH